MVGILPIKAGYLLPHPPVLISAVGRGRQHICEKTLAGYKRVAEDIRSIAPEIIVTVSPHGPLFSDGMAIGGDKLLKGDFKDFGAAEIAIAQPNAREWVDRIVYEAGRIDVPLVCIDSVSAKSYRVSTALDHGVMVPLWFVNQEWKDYRLIQITYGLLSYERLYAFGKLLGEMLSQADENAVVIASGDLSHCLKDDGPYAFHPDGPEFDCQAVAGLSNGDFKALLTIDKNVVKNAGECAYRSLMVLGGTLDECAFTPKVYAYEGPFGVGYCVAGFEVDGIKESIYPALIKEWKEAAQRTRKAEDPWVTLARATVESFVRDGKRPAVPEGLPDAMHSQKHGVFVSIKGPGGLRGCIGTFAPAKESVALEIIENAVKAATEDPRFPSIELDELEDLSISVDVLMAPEPIESKERLNPKKYGVIVSRGRRRGLLLPDLDGVDTVDEQIRIALQKAGIMEDEPYELQRFEVIRHF